MLPEITGFVHVERMAALADAIHDDARTAEAARDYLATEDAWLDPESPARSWRAAARRLRVVECLHDRAPVGVTGAGGWLHVRPVPAGSFRVMSPEALSRGR